MKKSISSLVLLFVVSSFILLTYTNCSSGPSAPSEGAANSSGTLSGPVNASQGNVLPVSIGCGYLNEPCVSVTICVPGTNQCQTIPNVLLDTGSYGLRLFSQVSFDNFNSVSNLQILPMVADPRNSSNVLSECVSYADGSSDWGPLATADVKLGSETASSVPIQIINAGFSTLPSGCTDADTSPIGNSGTGFNGILGVGLFAADCGAGCAPAAHNATINNGIYFSCPANGSGTCTGAAVSESLQTTNPVSLLPTDNNGVILELPTVPISFGYSDGATSAYGYLVLGIGTESNNMPGGSTTTLVADSNGNFMTSFNGVTSTNSFIDSGSNALYFAAPSSVSDCSDNGFYCPTSELSYTATQRGANGVGSQAVSFSLGNADYQLSRSNPNSVFADIGGPMSADFDWGLPFFFGRSIYVGIDRTTSSLGTGPLWAY